MLFNERTGRSYGAVIPDLLIETSTWRLPGDVKYKLYDERRLDPADIYQVFVYAYGFHHGLAMPTAFVIYPVAAGAGPAPRLRVRNVLGAASARLEGLALDVPATIEALRTVLPRPVVARHIMPPAALE